MDYSEKWGTDIEEAVAFALADLKLSRDEVEVTVLEQPSKGFLGLGAKLAKVRVEKKAVPAPEKQDKPDRDKVKPEGKKPQGSRENKKDNGNRSREKEEKKAAAAFEKSEAVAEKEVSAIADEEIISDTAENISSAEKKENGNKKKHSRKDRERKASTASKRPDNLEPVTEHPAITFLQDVSREMGLEVNIKASMNDEIIYVDIDGKDSGTIIGKRGATLDAVQYLTSLVVNKQEGRKYMRVVVDAENYRQKREKTLEQLAERLANKVVKTGKRVRLEPMNPYERKVIHATLQNHPDVTTRSEGEEPYRRVIIELK